MKGWIIDCYPDYEHDCIVIWIKTNRGIERLVDKCFFPKFYVWAPEERLMKLADDLTMFDVNELTLENKKIWLGEEEEKLTLGVAVNKYRSLNQLARQVSRWGDYKDCSLFNVDMRFEQRYFLAYDLFPMGLVEFGKELRSIDSPYRLDYPIPNLRTSNLKVDVKARNGIPTFDDPIRSVQLDEITIDGSEESILTDLDSLVRKIDPDVIYTCDGDGFYMHYLAKRAERNDLRFDLGRESGGRFSKGKSYFTYGRILYKPPAHKLRGRIHVDTSSSFMFAESGIYGLIDLSRLCGIPVQDLSRLSPGSAISAMQVNEALRTGHLVLWKKNLPERFKTARELIVCDRGGFIYEPSVGIHDGIVEVDFASLYPNIMVRHNVSPETVMCDCCPNSSKIVPEIGYRICEKRIGLIPLVLGSIIKRRLTFKRLMKGDGRRREIYEERSKILKWVLVTCFGYTGYRNARFGRIECHESITAYGREILLRTSEIAERHGFRIVHGIMDSLWLEGDADPTE
ncbi:MAG: DNA polymerase domain-containing protein, partial [Methanomassiliicoccales archaeon]